MSHVFIGLGSNLDNPSQHILKALNAIKCLAGTTLISVSNAYRSIAVGPGEQPDYVNAACHIETTLSAIQLLDQLQAIENHHGRVRDIRWGARTLDLDIVSFDDISCNTERLILPHPRAHERDFVLRPLLDIDRDYCFPNGEHAADLLQRADNNGITLLITTREIWSHLT